MSVEAQLRARIAFYEGCIRDLDALANAPEDEPADLIGRQVRYVLDRAQTEMNKPLPPLTSP